MRSRANIHIKLYISRCICHGSWCYFFCVFALWLTVFSDLIGSDWNHACPGVWFSSTDASKSCNICFIFYFCKQKHLKFTAGVYSVFSHLFISLFFSLYPRWLELAAALPIPWRKSCKANDASRGSIHCWKMSNKVLWKWSWLKNVAVHYYLENRG